MGGPKASEVSLKDLGVKGDDLAEDILAFLDRLDGLKEVMDGV